MIKNVSLNEIVEDYLIEQGQDTLHSFPRVLKAAVTALRELEWDITGAPVSVMCDKDGNNQIDIPADCVNLIDVGVINQNGDFVSLERDYSYAPKRTYDDCGNPINLDKGNRFDLYEQTYSNLYSGTQYYNRHGEKTGRRFGLGGKNFFGAYNIDNATGKINISTDAKSSSYMLIYLSNLETVSGKIMVGEFMREPILAGIEWVLNRRLRSVSRGEKQVLQNQFEVKKQQLSMRLSSLTMEAMMFSGWRGVKQSKF